VPLVALDLTDGRASDPQAVDVLWQVAASPDGRLYTNTFIDAGEVQRRDPVTGPSWRTPMPSRR
jgi:hypothetical protein